MTSVVHSMPSGEDLLRVATQDEELTLPIVKATEDHRSYILSTWVRSYASAARNGRAGVDYSIWLREEPRSAERLWSKSWVVTSPTDPFVIHGWICAEPNKLHYIYVPPELRGKGMATALTHHYAGQTYEHGRRWPFSGKSRLVSSGSYNPYLLAGHGGSQ